MALLRPSTSISNTASGTTTITSTPSLWLPLSLPRPSYLLLTLLRPLYPTLEVAHRLLLNSLALSLLACTLPFSIYLTLGQTARIARGEGIWGMRVKELSGLLWEGFDWLEECEDEGVLREWIERTLGGGEEEEEEDGLHDGSHKRRPQAASNDDAFGPNIAAARRDSGIEILDG
ncbi:hypothetical protein BCV69DRAFT_90109 [Microstroma glucosiphilum]|uniref:Uncharacterized protein n=1 Tax=Pseudomicrostroma glucosiphilum TaxID=1684307 RepID=A0A316TZ81_9BASI|nr:hypothetical protein BCV69DRAFT_90109 [Pseudomicrostroma glucosiphilum]PWN17978.1 hypothetical protein BCV69DRAFT_90109 [Pseudomicrostroma glucosiphilum]